MPNELPERSDGKQAGAPAEPVKRYQIGPAPRPKPVSAQPYRPSKPPPENPRKVRSGVKLRSRDGTPAQGWAAQRWIRLVESLADGETIKHGLEYATIGQTKNLEVEEGVVHAEVQGRAARPYQVNIEFKRFTPEQWEQIIAAMVDQAKYAAMLLAGELPTNIEDLLDPLGIQLFPSSADEIHPSCTCVSKSAWCRHAGCAAYILGDRLDADPFVVFELRGMPKDELLERLRQMRATRSAGDGPVPVYLPLAPAGVPTESKPLEDLIDDFWTVGPGAEQTHMPLHQAEVRQPLLRRLGPSPFKNSRFPLVGLLATCYDVISTKTLGDSQR